MRLSILVLILATAGCAPATVSALRSEAAGKVTFEVEQNYQPVYRTVVEQARKCFTAWMITAQMAVQGDLYTDLRQGTVSVALHGGLGTDTYLAVDVKAIDDARTRVDAYHVSPWAGIARAVEEWVRHGSQSCGPQQKS